MLHFVIILMLLFTGVLASPIEKKHLDPIRVSTTCQSCHPVDPNKINVHLIPHSHDDVGWLKTYSQYYYGLHNEIQKAGVRYIISSTVEALKANPNRRFVQVETAYLWKWWHHQSRQTQQDFRNLVNNGQIEIINGAWSMNDEANVNYQSIIDQFTWGMRFINDTLGECSVPRIGWQIDPFGHSREHASILTQLGFDGLFFARLDFQDKAQRIIDKNLEILWKSSRNLNNTHLFTNMFPDFYFAPSGFCFDSECGDEEINDDTDSPEYNALRRAGEFAQYIIRWSKYYQTSNLLIPMGGDFHFQKAEKNFINMDKLIEAFQHHNDINLIYSTPSCYIKAVNDEAKKRQIKFVEKNDDFFPYGSDPHCYWTGYFTSRPNAKRFERISNNILQAAKQLTSFNRILHNKDFDDSITPLRRAVGILQHHDAITGTEKLHVAKDYARMLSEGIKKIEPNLSLIITNLLKRDPKNKAILSVQTCLKSNISVCDPTMKSDSFIVTIYNPLARNLTHYVHVPVPEGNYKITGPDGDEPFDIVDSISDFSYLKAFNETPNPKVMIFAARNLPPLGLKLYYVEKINNRRKSNKSKHLKDALGTEKTLFKINKSTGRLSQITMNDVTLKISQEFRYYEGANYNQGSSGAYIFRPKQNHSYPFDQNEINYTIINGYIVDELRQNYNSWIKQIIRVYKGDDNNFVEFDWLIGPIEVVYNFTNIPQQMHQIKMELFSRYCSAKYFKHVFIEQRWRDEINKVGKEIITKFTIDDFNNNNTFYTDSNGREMMKRQLNKRYDYEYNSTNEPIASNYYPITSKIFIDDQSKSLRVAVLNDRAQGGSSLKNGEIELMVHRRLLKDDDKGVGEALNDTEYNQGEVVRGQHYLIIGRTNQSGIVAFERELALKKLLSPIILIGATELSLVNVQDQFSFSWSGLEENLPQNVHLLTLETWKEDGYIIRLEHILEKNEDGKLSKPVVVNLGRIFAMFKIVDVKETTLGANQWLDDYENSPKFHWNIKNGGRVDYQKSQQACHDLNIELQPMQIRTFIVKVSKN